MAGRCLFERVFQKCYELKSLVITPSTGYRVESGEEPAVVTVYKNDTQVITTLVLYDEFSARATLQETINPGEKLSIIVEGTRDMLCQEFEPSLGGSLIS